MKKGTSSQDVTALGDRTPKFEVIPPKPRTIADHYAHSVSTHQGGRGRPRRYQNKEELIDAIKMYFNDITNHDGSYNRPPTWSGLGLFLGFVSKDWAKNYVETEEFGDVMSQTRLMIDVWRQEQTTVPSKGVNAAGLMYLMNRDDEQARFYDSLKNVTPGAETDNRPAEAGALIDDVWSKVDGKNK